jgi:DNA invertase Pin-like site-specific DNA recombinase
MRRKYAESLANPLVAVGYLRVSTEDQSLGPDAQRKQIEAWAEVKGCKVAAWHVDHGISGGTGIAGRPALFAAIHDLKRLHAAWLAVAKRDRLARDLEVILAVEKAVAAAGGRIACADGTTPDVDGAAGKFIRRTFDNFAEYERGVIQERTKAALAVKKARGERIGTIPYGYRLACDGRHVEPKHCGDTCIGCLMLEEDEHEQAVIQRARELRDRGVTLRGIASLLDLDDLKTRRGTAFTHVQVSKMLGRAPTPKPTAAPAVEAPPDLPPEVTARNKSLERIRRGV